MSATFAPSPPLTFPERPPWSGVGADGWDGLVGPDDLKLISASSVPDALANRQLENWKLRETIERLAAQGNKFYAWLQTDYAAAIEWAMQVRFEPSGDGAPSATDTGTAMHSLFECWLLGNDVPRELAAFIEADEVSKVLARNLWDFYHRFQPEPVEVETVCYDPAYGLAGRFDAKVRFKKMPELGTRLVDLKNAREGRYKNGGYKKPYADTQALQLAVYAHAPLTATFEPRLLRTERRAATRVYLLNRAEIEACRPSTPVDGACIIHNTPERIGLYPMDIGHGVHRRAVEAAGLHRWLNEESYNAVGQPLVPVPEVPAL